MEEGGGGSRSLVPGGQVLLVLCGLLEASGGGRALPQLSDAIPFRVHWPGTEFSLVSALANPVAISLPPSAQGLGPFLRYSLLFTRRTFSLGAHFLPQYKASLTPLSFIHTANVYPLRCLGCAVHAPHSGQALSL